MKNTVTTRTIDLARFKDSVGLTVSCKATWGINRKADKGKMTVSDNGTDNAAAKEMLTLGKKLIESKEYKAILSYYNDLKNNFIYVKTTPSFFQEGFVLVRREDAIINEIETRLKRAIGLTPQVKDSDGNLVPELPQLVQAFKAAYPAQVEAARAKLEPVGQWSPKDYPDVNALDEFFRIEWLWISFQVADGLPEALKAQETEKLNRRLEDAGSEIIQALRVSFADLIQHATEKLTPEPGEKKKVFRDSLIANIQEFIDNFNNRNFLGDVELASLVTKAKEILNTGNVTAQKLRDFSTVRENTVKAFTGIKAELDKMIETESSRSIELDDEPTPEPEAETTGQMFDATEPAQDTKTDTIDQLALLV